MDRTMSTLRVLHTPVTSAPSDLAICTAKVPTPPEAPLIRTFCPALTCPVSRRPCKATSAVGTDAACSKLRLLGLETTAPSRLTQMYWARAPALTPKTSSPGLNSATFLPTASTIPEKSDPGQVFLGFTKSEDEPTDTALQHASIEKSERNGANA